MITGLKAGMVAALLAATLAATIRREPGQPLRRTFAQAQPTSYALIDSALAAQRIDEETAHKYRVFAAFGDSRLPAEYRGTNPEPEPPPEVEKVGSLLDTFSAQTRAELAPFFMRPDEPGSWITLGTVSDQQPEPEAPAPSGEYGPVPASGASAFRFSRRPVTPGSFSRSRPSASRAPVPTTITWKTFTAAGGKAKVWAQDRYPGDAAKAAALASQLTSVIWPRLTTLMNREPASDAAFPPNGGDGALDFYLVHAPMEVDSLGKLHPAWSGFAKPSNPGNNCHASKFLLIHSDLPLVGNAATPGILSTAAHELFHAIEASYVSAPPCLLPTWIGESSATWAENFVYPDENSEHVLAKAYLELPHKPIDSWAQANHKYGAYLLPYFREKTSGQPDFMRQMWESFDRMGASLGSPAPGYANAKQYFRSVDLLIRRGVDGVLRGGFEETWPRFLAQIWNLPPVDAPDGYKQWDKLTHGVKAGNGAVFFFVDASAGIDEKAIIFPLSPSSDTVAHGKDSNNLPYLAGYFAHFAFNSSVRTVLFMNTIADMAQPHTSVWGIQKIAGTWQKPEDWSTDFQKSWCRDDSKEDLEELVIVFGNSDWEKMQQLTPNTPPTVKGYPTGCTGWVGTVTATFTAPNVTSFGTIEETAFTTARFEPDPDLTSPNEPVIYWSVVSGSVQWTARASGGQCTGNFSGTMPLVAGMPDGNKQATVRIADEGNGMRYTVSLGPWPEMYDPVLTWDCGSAPPLEGRLHAVHQWWDVEPVGQLVSNGGKTINGTFERNLGAGVIKWKWNFQYR